MLPLHGDVQRSSSELSESKPSCSVEFRISVQVVLCLHIFPSLTFGVRDSSSTSFRSVISSDVVFFLLPVFDGSDVSCRSRSWVTVPGIICVGGEGLESVDSLLTEGRTSRINGVFLGIKSFRSCVPFPWIGGCTWGFGDGVTIDCSRWSHPELLPSSSLSSLPSE